MSEQDIDAREFRLANVLTLEDLLDQGFKLVVHCSCCGKKQIVRTDLCVEKLGRAFPVHLAAPLIAPVDMQSCDPKDVSLKFSTH